MRVVVFKLGNQEFAFDIRDIREIVRWEKSIKLPNMPDYMEGISNLRGRVLPVINLAKKLALPVRNEDYSGSLIIIDSIENGQIAVKVDEISEIITIDNDNIEQAQKHFANQMNSRLLKIVKREGKLITLLEGKEILNSGEIREIFQGGYCEATRNNLSSAR